MLQLVPSQRPSLAVLSGGVGEASNPDPLLAFAGSVTGSHALVIAPNGLNLLCSLLRHGCAAATSQRLAERLEHEAYDVVFAPCIASAASVSRLVYQAKRALVPTGLLVAFVPTTTPDHEDVGDRVVQSMRLDGFDAIQTKETQDGLLVRGELPMHGLSNAMPLLTRRHA